MNHLHPRVDDGRLRLRRVAADALMGRYGRRRRSRRRRGVPGPGERGRRPGGRRRDRYDPGRRTAAPGPRPVAGGVDERRLRAGRLVVPVVDARRTVLRHEHPMLLLLLLLVSWSAVSIRDRIVVSAAGSVASPGVDPVGAVERGLAAGRVVAVGGRRRRGSGRRLVLPGERLTAVDDRRRLNERAHLPSSRRGADYARPNCFRYGR